MQCYRNPGQDKSLRSGFVCEVILQDFKTAHLLGVCLRAQFGTLAQTHIPGSSFDGELMAQDFKTAHRLACTIRNPGPNRFPGS